MKKTNSVLIVDDEKTNILALSHILGQTYNVYVSRDGQDAIDAAHENLPDIILLDVLMPGMDGYAVIKELKASEATREIPVIFITGLRSAQDEEKGLSLGAVDYISKPFHTSIVKLRVHNQIKLINQMREILAKELDIQSNRAKSEFLSRMSHELRTPMNAVMGMTRLARNTGDVYKKDEFLEKADAASRDLMQLIDDVLDITEIGNDELTLENAQFCFESALQELLGGMDARIGAKQHTVSIRLDPAIPEKLIGDKKRLFQVISVLLSNAVKFTPEHGCIELRASVAEVTNETLTLQVEVIDNGIGISRDQQADLFDLFEQADGGANRKFGGVGSGLYIAKHIAAMMGGGIKVESEPDKGSRFIFTAGLKTAGSCIKNNGFSFSGKTALFAEDIEINREIGIAMLEDTQIDVECVENGREALDKFASNPDKYDIIIMDINMPDMCGVEATRQIRGLSTPKGRQIPIIAMTANVLPEEVAGYMEAGMDEYIAKPVDIDILMRVLDKHLSKSA